MPDIPWKVFAAGAAVHMAVAALNLKIGFDYDETLCEPDASYRKADAERSRGVEPGSSRYWEIVNKNYEKEGKKRGVVFWVLVAKALGFDSVILSSRGPEGSEDLVAAWDWLHDGFYFTKDKAGYLRRHRFIAYIGDSDTDMEMAQKAGVWAIRVRRRTGTAHQGNYSPGKYGEWTLPFSG